MVFYDPLNRSLVDFESARDFKSDNWPSNHQKGFNYFEEYLPLFNNGIMELFPDLTDFKFKNSPPGFKVQLVDYIRGLIDFADKEGKNAIFKVEQLQGHVNVLREFFPSSLHIGLVRNSEDQFASWTEQQALGNNSFFQMAFDLILGDPDFFKPDTKLSIKDTREIYENFHSGENSLRSDMDLLLDLYEDEVENLLKSKLPLHFQELFATTVNEFRKVDSRPTFEKKFIRVRDYSIELIQQRDELIQQRDTLLNSTIWRLAKPLRDLINFLKA